MCCIGPSVGCLSGISLLGRSMKGVSQSTSSLTSLRKWMSWASDPVWGGQLASHRIVAGGGRALALRKARLARRHL